MNLNSFYYFLSFQQFLSYQVFNKITSFYKYFKLKNKNKRLFVWIVTIVSHKYKCDIILINLIKIFDIILISIKQIYYKIVLIDELLYHRYVCDKKSRIDQG